MAIAGQFVREAAHVAGALHVVLAAQGVHADAGPADIAGRHGKVGDRHDRRRTLRMLGHAKAVIDGSVPTSREQPRGCAQIGSRNTGDFFKKFGAVAFFRDEACPFLESVGLATLTHELLVDQTFGDDDVRHGGEHRNIGPRP